MKQFRCADIVPGCSATVRARRADEVVATATGHLLSVHDLATTPELTERVNQGVSTISLFRALFDTH